MNRTTTCLFSIMVLFLCCFFISSCTQQQIAVTESQLPSAREVLAIQKSTQEITVRGNQRSSYGPAYEDLMTKLAFLSPKKTPAEPFVVKIGTEKAQYNVGDPFEIRFGASKECYITIMDISTNGHITFFAPSIKIPNTKIEGMRVYSTLHDYDMKITVGPPNGIETINIFCSSEQIPLFEADFEKEPFYTITPSDEKRVTALMASLDQLQESEWSGNSIQFQIGAELPALVVAPVGPERGGLVGTPSPHSGTLSSIAEIGESNIFFPPIGATGTSGVFFPPIGATGTSGKTDQPDNTNTP